MSKADKEKNIDDDILQCKEDILHAHNTKPQQTGIRTTAAEKPSKKEKPAVKETPKVQIEQISKK